MTRRRTITTVLAITAALAFFVGLRGCAQSAFFHPDRIDRGTPADAGLSYVPIDFASRDGPLLSGWFIPATTVDDPLDAKATVIQFHGNAENITAHWHFVSWLPARGFNVFVFDYRGYGRSGGSPTVEGLLDDSIAALRHVAQLPDVDPARVVVLGQSLGGANAIAALAHPESPAVAAVAIESTFYSYSTIASEKVWFAGSLMDDRASPGQFVSALAPTPVLFLHGTDDRVISSSHSQRLFDSAQEPKQLVIIPGGEHLDTFTNRYGNTYRDLLVSFFMASLPEAPADAGRAP